MTSTTSDTLSNSKERNGRGSECRIDTFSDAFLKQMDNKNTSVNVYKLLI
jgi:hypothetical protein